MTLNKRATALLFLLLGAAACAVAQYSGATCPYDGAHASFTGATRQNRNGAPPATECQYSHQYASPDGYGWKTHTFWEPCGM
jgi:hypothetical protein